MGEAALLPTANSSWIFKYLGEGSGLDLQLQPGDFPLRVLHEEDGRNHRMLQWPQLGPSVLGKMAEKQEEPSNAQNGEPDNAEEGEGKKKKVKREDLPPFEIVTGERLPAIFFKFQFRNVEYSSGRNKTFLCYVVETQGKEPVTSRGYLEDEHAAAHAEMAFFNTILPTCQAGARHDVTWYVSSSPCVTCAQRICEALRKNKGLRLTIMVGRLFMWEEPEMQAALRSMKEAGCKLRIMKPQDFEYVWKNFVEQEEGEEAKSFVPWEDIQENFLYYEEKLAEILH